MIQTTRGTRGMAVAPHSLAAQAALSVMRDGGNAIEAMVAAASTIAVVYPHMNGIGGDGFWMISIPGRDVIAIDGCGPAAKQADLDIYLKNGASTIPFRGALAANTVAATVSGWNRALQFSSGIGGCLPVSRLLEDAIHYAENGCPVSTSQHECTTEKLAELVEVEGFADTFLEGGRPLAPGAIQKFPALAQTLKNLASDGLDGFYRGRLSRQIADDLRIVGSLVSHEDLKTYRARSCEPLQLNHSQGKIYNMIPPTQGIVSLIILGILDRLNIKSFSDATADQIHLIVEATKQAFLIRDEFITDPKYMSIEPSSFLSSEYLDTLAGGIRRDQAAPWPSHCNPGDTIWMGAIDANGVAVSFIQSIYHEFGSGIVLPTTGINWQNRGASFSLDPTHLNALRPGKLPFHTLNPALARLNDGRVAVYGTMGGDGQPQTQATIFTRYVTFGQQLQGALTAPRWLLGRTWGQTTDTLKVESRFSHEVLAKLALLGHDVEVINDFDAKVGHAGAIARHQTGLLEGAFDPRSDGCVAAF